MAVSFPRSDVLSAVGFVADGYEFKLNYRQEQSRSAGGVTFVKDLGSPLWTLKATTAALRLDDALDYEALLETLEGGVQTFMAYDLRRPYPRQHSTGAFSDTGVTATVGGNNKSIAVSGVDPGFQVSRGDYLVIEVAGAKKLHQVSEPSTASAGGVLALFEVRPHLWPGAAAGQPVRFKKPAIPMTMLPGSIAKTQMGALHTSINFAAMQDVS
jgi:hypothetical protein